MKNAPLKRRGWKTLTFPCVECGTLVQRAKRGKGLCRPCSQRKNAAKRGPYVHGGEHVPCEVCGTKVYVAAHRARDRRFCSRRCMGVALRKRRTCAVCADSFESAYPRKTCSAKCANELKGRSKAGAQNPNYTDGRTASLEVWLSTREANCRRCPTRLGRVDLHHVVYEQHVRRAGGDVYDPRNGLTLCGVCHATHHGQLDRGKVALSVLRDENYDFAFELLGPAAYDYLRRHYSGEDPRLDALLQREAA